ncbi:UPF0175 family protein [Oscillatoria sp. FACHB-1406]|uniref:UPF0175 family protein n=1 Tax=Oscillatoria sp. FACHB-1406 TaxID=2692846 RepID=UPI0016849325|nr:UPF0175 family protein [Oscillatoria sp. FACHB-1406]MBD2580664.1 UPF0175 family protein [Oscillatoria sp. FACHB-1406]
METQPLTTEIKFDLVIPGILAEHHLEAQRKAKEAYMMTLLKYGDISTGRAARLLDIPRVELIDSMGSYSISLFDETMTG